MEQNRWKENDTKATNTHPQYYSRLPENVASKENAKTEKMEFLIFEGAYLENIQDSKCLNPWPKWLEKGRTRQD